MARTIGRRPLFFLIAALICLALAPATPAELRYVNWATAGLGAFWGIVLALEELFGPGRSQRSRRRVPEGGTPFAPPPRPGATRSNA